MIVWLFLSLKAEKIFLNKIKSNIGSFVSQVNVSCCENRPQNAMGQGIPKVLFSLYISWTFRLLDNLTLHSFKNQGFFSCFSTMPYVGMQVFSSACWKLWYRSWLEAKEKGELRNHVSPFKGSVTSLHILLVRTKSPYLYMRMGTAVQMVSQEALYSCRKKKKREKGFLQRVSNPCHNPYYQFCVGSYYFF